MRAVLQDVLGVMGAWALEDAEKQRGQTMGAGGGGGGGEGQCPGPA